MNLKPFAIAGGCYKDDTLPWSAQDTVNWIPVVAEVEGTRTPVMLRGAPGLSATVGNGGTLSAFDSDGNRRGGIGFRGAYNADGVFVLAQDQTLYRYGGDGVSPTVIGTVPGVERCAITHNQITGGSQIVIANGTAGYVYNTVTGSFGQITDEGFPGAKSVDYIDSYIVGVEPGGRFWFNSALADATSYNTLDRYEAESAPDKIVGLITSHGEVIVFGERTMEFFYDSGAATGTFARRSGTQTEVGAVSQFAIAKLDNTVYWLGNDGLIYRLDGYTPVRISLQPIEQQIARSDLAKCFAMVYEDRGHKIVYFTFPDGLTWGYDVATREWHRRKSYGLNRWRVNTLTKWADKWYAGDYTNGSLCSVEWGINEENGLPLVAERVAAVMHANMNRFRLNAVELSVDAEGPTQYTAGQSTDIPVVTGPNLLFDVPDAWLDAQNLGGTPPPSVWTGTSYSLTSGATETLTSADAIDSEQLDSYPDYVAAGAVIAGHVAWTCDVANTFEFTVTIKGDVSGDIGLIDQITEGNSGEFDFSYTFDGTEVVIDPDVPSGKTIEIAIQGGGGESGSVQTAVITPQAQSIPGPLVIDKRIIELRTSKDGAHNWSYWRQHDMGAQGNFKDRPLFRRLGFGRRIVLHVRASGNFGRDLVACSIDTEPF